MNYHDLPLDIKFITFFQNPVWFAFYNILLKNFLTISSQIRYSITYVYGTIFLDFFNDKMFCWQLPDVTFCKSILIFCNFFVVINFKFRIYIITFNFQVKLCTKLNIGRFNFDFSMMCIVVITSNPSIIIFFEIDVK